MLLHACSDHHHLSVLPQPIIIMTCFFFLGGGARSHTHPQSPHLGHTHKATTNHTCTNHSPPRHHHHHHHHPILPSRMLLKLFYQHQHQPQATRPRHQRAATSPHTHTHTVAPPPALTSTPHPTELKMTMMMRDDSTRTTTSAARHQPRQIRQLVAAPWTCRPHPRRHRTNDTNVSALKAHCRLAGSRQRAVLRPATLVRESNPSQPDFLSRCSTH